MKRISPLPILVACAFFAIALCWIARWRYDIFRYGVDLGLFTQVVASTGSSFSSRVEGGVNHLFVHWSPILIMGYPFVRAFGAAGLQYLQAILIAAAILPLWGMARARFSPFGAFVAAVACGCYPILLPNALADFHEMAFVPLLAATFVYAVDRERRLLGVVAALLLACVKEDQFVALAWNGAVLALLPGAGRARRIFGMQVFLIGSIGAALYFGAFRSIFAHVRYWSFHFYDWSGYRPAAATFFGDVVAPRLRFVLEVLGPSLFVPVLSPYALFLIPGLVEIMASHEPITMSTGAHYSALLTGYVLAAFVDGLSRLTKAISRAFWPVVAATAATGILVSIYASPLAYWYTLYRLPNASDARLQRVLDELPSDADLGVEEDTFSHLGLNPNASIHMQGQSWFVYDSSLFSERWRDLDEPAVKTLLAKGAYRIARQNGSVVVLHRQWSFERIRPLLPPGQ